MLTLQGHNNAYVSTLHAHTILLMYSTLYTIARAQINPSTAPPIRVSNSSSPAHPLCKPQDMLPLSEPYERPAYQLAGAPICNQFECSCCNRSHALTIYRGMHAALQDISISSRCRDMIRTMGCRVCDPEVGVGLKPAVCQQTCVDWYDACKDEFFAFSDRSDRLVPCEESSKHLICSRLSMLADSGPALCSLAGYSIGDPSSGQCYDGSAVSRPDLCEKRKARSRSSNDDSDSSSDSLWSLFGLDGSFLSAEHEWTGTQKSLLMAGLVGAGMVILPRAQFVFTRWLRYRNAPVEWGTPNFAR